MLNNLSIYLLTYKTKYDYTLNIISRCKVSIRNGQKNLQGTTEFSTMLRTHCGDMSK